MGRQARLRGAALLFTALIIVGCTQSNPNAPARVSGRVTYNGKPVTGGTVTFHDKEGGAISVGIAGDGTYSAFDIPAGDMTVTVETESINPDRKIPEYKGGSAGGAAKMYGKGRPGGGGVSGNASAKPMPKSPAPEGTTVGTTYMKIPDKYAKPETSGLTVSLKKGDQKKDFELTD